MKHRYTAKVYFEDGQLIENTGDNLEQLTTWMSEQAEAAFSDIKGEIIDNQTHFVVQNIQYSPPSE